MVNFSQKYQILSDGSYQITATGSKENRRAVITKFDRDKTWSVAFYYSDKLKADDVLDGFKKLKDAKVAAQNHVDLKESVE